MTKPQPKKTSGIVSFHEGELNARGDDQPWAVSFGYFRGKHPRDVLPHKSKASAPQDQSPQPSPPEDSPPSKA